MPRSREVADRRSFVGREQPDKRIRGLECRAMLDFYSRKTELNFIKPEASQGKSEQGNNRAEGTT